MKQRSNMRSVIGFAGNGQCGFTLLEVLVALVVLSVGLLGLSGLQTNSLRNNYDAFLRSQATVMTTDILDRMRANRVGALADEYDIAYSDEKPAAVVCSEAACNPSDVADRDVLAWLNQVGRLPNGEGYIDVNDEDIVEVGICWSETREASAACGEEDSTKRELITRTQL